MDVPTAEHLAAVNPAGLLTAAEVAALFRCHRGHVVRLVREGVLRPATAAVLAKYRLTPTYRNGKARYAFLGSDVLRYARARRKAIVPGPGVRVIARSLNRKIGYAAATIAARQTCPAGCPFRGAGCYAESDQTRSNWDRVTNAAPAADPEAVARAEAALVDLLPADRDLRLHVAGDSPTRAGTRALAAACDRYSARGRAPLRPPATPWRAGSPPFRRPVVWAYTHAWREVERADWGGVSVLASCETAADAAHARARGYAVALAVPEFPGDRAYRSHETTVIPCPNQTRGRVCTNCRLCFDDKKLFARGLAVGFAAHGAGKRLAAGVLRRLELPMAAA